MLRILKKWFNENCHYWKGVVIYGSVAGHDPSTLQLLKKSRTPANETTLLALLTEVYNKENANHLLTEQPDPVPALPSEKIDLYQVCKTEADTEYKKVMNDRAVLFSLIEKKLQTQDDIDNRRVLALSVAKGYKEVSALYDKANYVKEHGMLPDSAAEEKADPEISDVMLKPSIDNLRKNINKMKKRPLTAERAALLLKHQQRLSELEERWGSLKIK